MSGPVLLPACAARRVPWKNGRGVTQELAIGPRGATFEAGDFDWRVSRAAVVEAGPFSAFPGLDRVIVVLEGEGLRLAHGDAAPVDVPPLAPHRFPGDVATTASLLCGPVADFNVLTRRGRRRAEVRVVRVGAVPARLALPAGTALVFAARGPIEVAAAGAAVALGPGDAALLEEERGSEATLASAGGEAVALVVSIVPVERAAGTAPRA